MKVGDKVRIVYATDATPGVGMTGEVISRDLADEDLPWLVRRTEDGVQMWYQDNELELVQEV